MAAAAKLNFGKGIFGHSDPRTVNLCPGAKFHANIFINNRDKAESPNLRWWLPILNVGKSEIFGTVTLVGL